MYDLEYIQNTKGMHLNVRSIVNKWDNIKANFIHSGIHVLSFSETWLHALLPDNLFSLGDNYTLVRNDRNWNDTHNAALPPKKGGGLCMYMNNKLDFSSTTFEHLNTSTIDLESQWVMIKQKPNKTILIGNLHKPPQGNINNCLDILETVLSHLDLIKIEVILIGDLNIDILEINNNMAKDLLNRMKQLGLRQLIKEPTRFSPTKDSCIDLIFTNSNIISRSGVSNINISDHQMVLLTRKKAKFLKQKCDFIGRSYRNYNKELFLDRIKNADWTFLATEMSMQDQWETWLSLIRTELDKMCPLKTFRIKQVKQPWITPGLIELIKDKDKALKNAKKTKNPVLWTEAKRLRNACTNRLKQAKANFIKDQLTTHSNDQKKFWKNIQEVISNKSSNNRAVSLLDDKNKSIDTDKTADFINDFFRYKYHS